MGRQNLVGSRAGLALLAAGGINTANIPGQTWQNSGQALGTSGIGNGFDTGITALPAGITLLCQFISFDAASTAGYGAPLLKNQYAFNFHHANTAYQAGFTINDSSLAYPNIQFGETQANVLRTWVGTWDGARMAAFSNGRIAGTHTATASLATAGTVALRILTDTNQFAFNGFVSVAAVWPIALNDALAKRLSVSSDLWGVLFQAPPRKIWIGVSGSATIISLLGSTLKLTDNPAQTKLAASVSTASLKLTDNPLQNRLSTPLTVASLKLASLPVQNKLQAWLAAAALKFTAQPTQNRLVLALNIATLRFTTSVITVTGAVATVIRSILALMGIGS